MINVSNNIVYNDIKNYYYIYNINKINLLLCI
jgi:hypothetical protein